MKKIKFLTIAILMVAALTATLSSCKKGTDDPVVSLRTRNDRFTNTWTLTKYEKNGVIQNLSGTTYIYNVYSQGTLKQTIEGSIFGFPTRTVNDGTWSFLNDDEDVKIKIGTDETVYNINRLANKELWLKKVTGTDTHMYYFDGTN
jgi:hypothetical protein